VRPTNIIGKIVKTTLANLLVDLVVECDWILPVSTASPVPDQSRVQPPWSGYVP
jgi:hypothetical protein